jgi:hypothetical protein
MGNLFSYNTNSDSDSDNDSDNEIKQIGGEHNYYNEVKKNENNDLCDEEEANIVSNRQNKRNKKTVKNSKRLTNSKNKKLRRTSRR